MNINSYERIPNDGKSIRLTYLFPGKIKINLPSRNIKNVLKVSFSFFLWFVFLLRFPFLLSIFFSIELVYEKWEMYIFLGRKKYLIIKCLSTKLSWTIIRRKKRNFNQLIRTDFMHMECVPMAECVLCINGKVLILACFSTSALGLPGPEHLKKLRLTNSAKSVQFRSSDGHRTRRSKSALFWICWFDRSDLIFLFALLLTFNRNEMTKKKKNVARKYWETKKSVPINNKQQTAPIPIHTVWMIIIFQVVHILHRIF